MSIRKGGGWANARAVTINVQSHVAVFLYLSSYPHLPYMVQMFRVQVDLDWALQRYFGFVRCQTTSCENTEGPVSLAYSPESHHSHLLYLFIFIHLCVLSACMSVHVCVPPACSKYLGRPEEGVESLGLELQTVVRPPCQCCESKLGLLQEQPMLLNSEPPLQPHVATFSFQISRSQSLSSSDLVWFFTFPSDGSEW